MAETPVRLVGPALVATGPTTVLTVGASTKDVVTHVHVYNPGAGAVNFTMSIGADAAATRVFDAYPVAEDVPLDYYTNTPLTAGEVIQIGASVNNQLVIIVDGRRITL